MDLPTPKTDKGGKKEERAKIRILDGFSKQQARKQRKEASMIDLLYRELVHHWRSAQIFNGLAHLSSLSSS